MLEDGLSYPVRGDWIGRVIIGGVLGFLSFLLLPVLPLYGYLVRVLETTVNGDESPPEFTDWGDLTVTGLVALVITLAYTIVPLVAYAVFVTVVAGAGGAVGGDAGAVIGGLGLLTALAFVPVVLLAYYAVPAALTAYAIEDDLGAAFDVDRLKPVLLSGEYLAAVLLPVVIAFVLWIVTMVLAFTVVGLVFVPFIQFYGQVTVFRMFGSAFGSVSDRTSGAGDTGAGAEPASV